MKGKIAVLAAAGVLYAYGSHAPAAVRAAGGTAATRQGPVTRNANEALANKMAASGYRWTGTQATCLDELWTEESGFSATAANPTSDARGIAQNISGWSAGYRRGDASQQIGWGLSYIAGRYGAPCAAWAHEKSETPNWY